jgi:hypothetical protein
MARRFVTRWSEISCDARGLEAARAPGEIPLGDAAIGVQPAKVVAVALANKTVRIALAVTKKQIYRARSKIGTVV